MLLKMIFAWFWYDLDTWPTTFFYIILLWPSYLTLKISSRSLHTLHLKALFMWSISQIGLSGKYIIIYALKKEFSRGPFGCRHYVSKVWARLNKGERRYALDKDFVYNSAMTLTVDLKTWFKVTAHPLPIGTLCMKYEPDLVKGREDMLQTSNIGWKDGGKDGRTDGRTDWSL